MTPAVSRAIATDTTAEVLDVLWGLGSGRRARALLREGRRVEILALDVEPSRPELAQVVVSACERLRAAQGEGRLRVVVGTPSGFAQRWHELGNGGAAVTMHVDLAALASVPPAARDLAQTIERLHLERLDLHRFAARMRRNLVDNVDALASASPLSCWAGAGAGRPAFVLAAGPSARASMPWLAEARALGPVVAVDTALPLCREFGVPIDCLVSVDPHASSRVHLQRGADGVHALAFQPFCTPALVGAVGERVLALPAGDALCDRAAIELGLPSLPVAGTVLLYALQIAAALGCDPVILVGADFAHVGGRSHAEGTATAHLAPPTGEVIADARGVAVPTSSALRRFAGVIARHIDRSGARHWRVEGGGAHLAGARTVELAAVGRWVRRAARGRAPTRWLPRPVAPPAAVVADRRATWLRLLGEFDGA